MMKKLFLFAALLSSSVAFGQNINQNLRISADPALVRKLSSAGPDISGNPFLFEDWKNVTVVFEDKDFQSLQADIKYNLIANELLVRSEGVEGVFKENVKEFILKDGEKLSIFRKGFSGSGLRENVFVEVLTDGSIKFLKHIEKVVIESRGYNTGTIEKKVDQSIRYYFEKDGKVSEIKLNEKAIFEFLKSPEAESYVKANKLNLRKETDVASLLRNVIK